MTSASRLQNCYISLYKVLRFFIFDFHTVDLISDIEVEVYKAFPDMDRLRNSFNQLRMNMKRDAYDFESLQKAFDKFQKALDETDEIYAKITVVDEVLV